MHECTRYCNLNHAGMLYVWMMFFVTFFFSNKDELSYLRKLFSPFDPVHPLHSCTPPAASLPSTFWVTLSAWHPVLCRAQTQGWAVSSIFEEYTHFASPKDRLVDQRVRRRGVSWYAEKHVSELR